MRDVGQHFYSDVITTLSEQHLQQILEVAEPPVCLIGGWAVHAYATNAFERQNGTPYLGSRDIDIAVHVDPSWSREELLDKPVGHTIDRIEDELPFKRGRFGFYQYYRRNDAEPLTDDQAAELPQHDIFRVDIDVLPSTDELDTFEDAFGFRPPSEPLLSTVFNDGRTVALSEYVDWNTDANLPTRAVLAAMKIRAYPKRGERHKQTKDIADLHAVVWYGGDYAAI